jgi:universal stress protein A
MKDDLKQKAHLLYLVDHRENVREEFAEPPRPAMPPQPAIEPMGGTKKVVFCTDFSENSVPARFRAVEYAKAFNAELIVAHVWSPRVSTYPAFEAMIPVDVALVERKIREAAETQLETIAQQCRAELKTVTIRLVSGIPSDEIVRLAEEERADLIVMGTHGWSGLRHLVLGSAAETVVRMAKTPVLTVRAPAKR